MSKIEDKEKKEELTFTNLRNINLLSGACLGGLVGIMLGMSVSETVSGVLMALTALLGAFFGLSDLGTKNDNPLRLFRIIGFSVLCITSLITGVAVRTSNAFAPSPEAELLRWEKIVGKSRAVEIVLTRHFGMSSSVADQKSEGKQLTMPHLVGSSVLFSTELSDTCSRVDSDVYTDAAILAGALKQEKDARWHRLAEQMPAGSNQLISLQAAIQLVCRK